MLIAFPSLIFAIVTLLIHFTYKSKTEAKLDDLKMELLGESENKTSFEAKYNQAMSELKRYEELKKGKDLDEIQLLFTKVNMLDDKITFLNSSSKNKFDTIIAMIESLKSLNEDNTSLIKNIIIDSADNEKNLEDIENSFNHIKEQTAIKNQELENKNIEVNSNTNIQEKKAETKETENVVVDNKTITPSQPKIAPIFADSYANPKQQSTEEDALNGIFSKNKEEDIFDNVDAYSNDFLEEEGEGNNNQRSYTFNDVFEEESKNTNETSKEIKQNLNSKADENVDFLSDPSNDLPSSTEDNFLVDFSKGNDTSVANNEKLKNKIMFEEENTAPVEKADAETLLDDDADLVEKPNVDTLLDDDNTKVANEVLYDKNNNTSTEELNNNIEDDLEDDEIEEVEDNSSVELDKTSDFNTSNNEDILAENSSKEEGIKNLETLNMEQNNQDIQDIDIQDKTVSFKGNNKQTLDDFNETNNIENQNIDINDFTDNSQDSGGFDNQESYDINLLNMNEEDNSTQLDSNTNKNDVLLSEEKDNISENSKNIEPETTGQDDTINVFDNTENNELGMDDSINDVKQAVKMQEEEEKHKEDLKNETDNSTSFSNTYEDFPPMPTYIDKDGVSLSNDTPKKESIEKNNINTLGSTTKVAPKSVLSNNNSTNIQDDDSNIGFDIKDSIEKLKAQLNSSNEDNY